MLFLLLFLAGLLTILLPCILPLVPIVLGVSIAGRSRIRPLLIVLGMVVSFVAFTFLLYIVLGQFIEFADYLHIATIDVLLLFGVGFLFEPRLLRWIGAAAGGLFFVSKGIPSVLIAGAAGVLVMEIASRIAPRIQQLGTDAQTGARAEFGQDSLVTAFIVGLTLGLVWVPCAGPALGVALALVREQPGLQAFLALSAYAVGAGIPLLLVGYGGQAAVHSARMLARYSGRINQIAGVLLVASAVALSLNLFQAFQVWLVSNTGFGDIGTRIEEQLVNRFNGTDQSLSSSSPSMSLPILPKISRAPEFTGLGPWHNSQPFTIASLKGKVVLVDFWTYSCINCIRTLPYVQGYWDKYERGKLKVESGTLLNNFVVIGVHTPEFTFEKSQSNVAMAIKEHGLTYPVVQDNDYGTWNAFANHYWPAKYLIDANGYIRYEHFGEGDYEQTDLAIQSLLNEIGVSNNGKWTPLRQGYEGQEMENGKLPEAKQQSGNVSPETYIGSRSWPAFGNQIGDPDNESHVYSAPDTLALNKYYLDGTWQLSDDQEYQSLVSDSGKIAMRFTGGEINLVMGLDDGAKPVQASVMVDGKPGKTFTIDRHDLFNLFKGTYGQHDIFLKLQGKSAEAFAFTFGG